MSRARRARWSRGYNSCTRSDAPATASRGLGWPVRFLDHRPGDTLDLVAQSAKLPFAQCQLCLKPVVLFVASMFFLLGWATPALQVGDAGGVLPLAAEQFLFQFAQLGRLFVETG